MIESGEMVEARVGTVNAFEGKILAFYAYALFVFPGAVLHEFAHYLAVLAAGLTPRKVVWFSLRGDYLGYVSFEYDRRKTSIWSLALVHFAPLFLSSFLALALFESSFGLMQFGAIGLLLLYVACSLAFTALPSWVDFKNFYEALLVWPAKKLTSGSVVDKVVLVFFFVPWLALLLASKILYLLNKALGNSTLNALWALFLVLLALRF
ncbi:hypothetical protein COX85_03660 [Candidatus Micrarchaeota archaeon CG_4_10_14_0_2_um_filter_55_9]|nr:MAG: hypothetical protein AUJ15_00860 [Candidatus Micrarchaeota archaeon CG1_02_55_41]PIO02483.1 MAG: hypothetical protein COT57_03615 [Candidatus Micrarchaeota archaeon CG09_land_8_20_14_0_10_55_25]PIZ91480.1 MAG: hypothetical protein COX85_03660 [Candidatus Micrarchaeota archaeon CG_4_10_14_0_2_um_filter_55_9]PJD00965.1 MAG: hypothetical protein COU38_03480 [Candidatus Micrarchaeota archaeon CG10_big_fil_rev_8_21_14_0_10_54_18]